MEFWKQTSALRISEGKRDKTFQNYFTKNKARKKDKNFDNSDSPGWIVWSGWLHFS